MNSLGKFVILEQWLKTTAINTVSKTGNVTVPVRLCLRKSKYTILELPNLLFHVLGLRSPLYPLSQAQYPYSMIGPDQLAAW